MLIEHFRHNQFLKRNVSQNWFVDIGRTKALFTRNVNGLNLRHRQRQINSVIKMAESQTQPDNWFILILCVCVALATPE